MSDQEIREGDRVYCVGQDNHQRVGRVEGLADGKAFLMRPGKYGPETWWWPVEMLRRAVTA